MGPTNKRAMSLAIIECFLKGGNLCKVLSHMCNNASSSVMDPVSDIVHMMMTCPVQMVISEVGVSLFKDHPNALYPFSAMDDGQLAYVEGHVISCMNQHQQNVQRGSLHKPTHTVHMQMGGGCVLYCTDQDPTAVHYTTSISGIHAVRKNKPPWTLATDQSKSGCGGTACDDDSGGGGRGSSSGGVGAAQHCAVLRTRDVLRALCSCVFASKRYGNPQVRYAVCSIIMQRVSGMAHVSTEDQRDAHSYALELLESEEAVMMV